MNFLDLHSHILAGIDDGSGDDATTLDMLRGLSTLGFSDVCATPHQKSGQFMPTQAEIQSAYTQAKKIVEDNGVDLTLHIAAENMWDEVFHTRFRENSIPSYDGGPAILVEVPPKRMPLGIVENAFELRRRGFLPVLAHPERYEALWKDDELLFELQGQCAFVVDLGAVAGFHGRKQATFARRWVKDGTAQAAASDAHTAEDIRVAAAGIDWIKKKAGSDAVNRLLAENPRKIIQGIHPLEA